MSKMRVSLIALLLSLIGVTAYAQVRVYGYFPSYRQTTVLTNQYDKLTDIAFSFINPNTNGTLNETSVGGDLWGFEMNKFITVRDNCQTNGVNLWISLAGADDAELRSARMKSVCSNSTYRAALVSDLIDFCETHGCYGISLDWEFPKDADARNAHVALIEDLHTAIASSSNPNLKIAIAVGGEYTGQFTHINYVHSDLFGSKEDLIDEWHIMSYDYPSSYDANHSTLDDSKLALQTYAQQGASMDKMFMGVPFYGRNSGRTNELEYNNMGCNATNYNSDSYNGYYYNGRATIEDKIDEVVNLGAEGIIIWDLGQDCTNEYSLLNMIKNYVDAQCPIPDPNMGPDVGICGGGTTTLDPGVSTSTGRTFTWYKDGVVEVNASSTQNTLDVTDAATYRVVIAESCGQKEDEIKVAAGSSVTATGATGCANEDLTLTVTNPQAGKSYLWYDQEVGGGKLHTGTSYTAQYSATDYLYVEEQEAGVVEYENIVADDLGSLPSGVYYAFGDVAFADLFTAETDVTIKTIRFYASAQTGATFTVQLLSGLVVGTSNAILEETAEIVIDPVPGADAAAYVTRDVEVNFVVTPGEYFIYPNITSGDLALAYSFARPDLGTSGVYALGEHAHRDFGNGFLTAEVSESSYANFGYNWRYWLQTGVSSSCGRTEVVAIVESGADDAPSINGVTTVDAGTTETYSPATYNLGTTYTYTYSGTGATITPGANGTVDVAFAADATSGTLTLEVDNGSPCGTGATSDLSININVPNEDPVLTVDASATSGIEGDVIVFTWSATDPNGDNVTFTVDLEGSAVSGTASPYSWTATPGSHTLTVEANDGNGGVVTETVTVTIVANQLPVVNLSSDVTSGITGDDVTFTWSATDPEGESLDVKIFLNGQEQSWSSPYTWTSTTGDHLIRVEAEDPRGGVSSQEISVTITDPANESPSVDGISVNPDPADVGEDVSISVSSSDNDGTVASINISVDGQDLVGPNATWTPTSDGDFTINVTVTDDDGATASDSYVITVNAVAVNQDPVINSVTASPNPAETGQTVSIAIDAVDNDGSIASIETTVDNQTLSGSNVSFTPSTAGTYTVSVVVTDDQGATDTYSTTVLVNDPSTGGTGTDGGCDDFEEAEGNGVYFAANESVFATSRSNGVYEVTVTHGSESIWAPVFANFADENGNDQSIDVSGNPTGSVVVSNPSSEVVEVYFTIRDGSGAKATADISSGSANVWGGRMGPGESMTVNFDLTQARTRSWSDGTGCAGDFVAPNHCMVNEGLDLTDITNVEWSINKGLDASPWNEALDGVTVTFDDFVFGVCPNDVVDPGNQDPVIASIDVNPNPAEVDENVSINVVASDADGTIASYSISVDGQVFNSSSATWSTSTAGTYTINVTVTDNEGATATSSASVTVEESGNNNGGGTDMVTILSPAQGEDIENPGIITVEIEADAAVENVYVLVTYPDGTSQYKPAYDADGDGIYNFIIVPDQNTGIGSYSMEVIARDGNGGEDRETLDFSTSGVVDFSDDETGIATSTVFSGVVVYPMPAVEFVNVELSTYSNGSGTAEILDMNGNVRYETEVSTSGASATTVQMSVENLNTGIYFIRLTVDGDTIVEKLIVE